MSDSNSNEIPKRKHKKVHKPASTASPTTSLSFKPKKKTKTKHKKRTKKNGTDKNGINVVGAEMVDGDVGGGKDGNGGEKKYKMERRSTRSENYHNAFRLPFFMPPKTSDLDGKMLDFQEFLAQEGTIDDDETLTDKGKSEGERSTVGKQKVSNSSANSVKTEETEIEEIYQEYEDQEAAEVLRLELGNKVPNPPNKFPRSVSGKRYEGYKAGEEQLQKNLQLYTLAKQNKFPGNFNMKLGAVSNKHDIIIKDDDIRFSKFLFKMKKFDDVKSNVKKDFPFYFAVVALVFTILAVATFFGLKLNTNRTSATLETGTTASPTTESIPVFPSMFPSMFPTSFPTTNFPTGFPTTFPTPFPTVTSTRNEALITEICAGTPGTKKFVGMCVDSTHYAQCDQSGKVVTFSDNCDAGIVCACEPFVRVADKNPCSSSNGNSCDLDG